MPEVTHLSGPSLRLPHPPVALAVPRLAFLSQPGFRPDEKGGRGSTGAILSVIPSRSFFLPYLSPGRP